MQARKQAEMAAREKSRNGSATMPTEWLNSDMEEAGGGQGGSTSTAKGVHSREQELKEAVTTVTDEVSNNIPLNSEGLIANNEDRSNVPLSLQVLMANNEAVITSQLGGFETDPVICSDYGLNLGSINHGLHWANTDLKGCNKGNVEELNTETYPGDQGFNVPPVRPLNCNLISRGKNLAAQNKALDPKTPRVLTHEIKAHPTAEIEEQPSNVRTWKRMLRQPQPNEVSVQPNSEKKRKEQFLPFVSSPVAQNFEEAKVANLIDPVSKQWRTAFIQSIFSSRDSELIQSIPLSSFSRSDMLVWPHTPSGVYTVKSRYRFLCKAQSFDENNYQPAETKLWKKVWGLQVLPKVRNLVWRAIKDSVPSKVNLRRRRILVEDVCDHCKGAPEDTVHALWSCPLLAPVWAHDPCWSFRTSQTFASFSDLVQYLIEKGVDLNFFSNVVWTIWHRRNALRTCDKPFPIHRVLRDAQSIQASFVHSIPPKPPDEVIHVPRHMGWSPPVNHMFKVYD
nr:putative ribonuclease h protein [Quercus suber]